MDYDAHVAAAERETQLALGHSWTLSQAVEMMRHARALRHNRIHIRRSTFLSAAL
jgi:hypothetical protein